ncbi:MAG TPA: GDSL-type esterase/lipase family protein [Sphingobacteriaceae bacterium]
MFRFLIVFCFFLLTAWPTQAQVKVDSTTRPAIYDARAGQFRSFPNSRRDIIFLGNSITAYGNWEELLGTRHAKNRGIPGDNTFGVLERLDEVIEGKPSKVFILLGINDVGRGFPDSMIIKNYQRIIRRIKLGSPRTKIFIHTLLPVNNTFKPALAHFNKDEHILAVNNGIKMLAVSENITMIDLYTPFLDKDNRLDKDYAFDGLHLNGKGYLKWAELLKKGNYLK